MVAGVAELMFCSGGNSLPCSRRDQGKSRLCNLWQMVCLASDVTYGSTVNSVSDVICVADVCKVW